MLLPPSNPETGDVPSRLKTVSSASLDSDKQHQPTQSTNGEAYEDSAPMTGFSGLTDSPIQTSPLDISSTEPSPVDPGSTSRETTSAIDTLDLKDQLNKAFSKSPYGGQGSFLPVNDLERLMNIDSVSKYCSTYAAATLGQQTSKVIDYVFGSQAKERGFARHVFAILVLIDQPDLIPGVIEQDIRDGDLPLAQCQTQGIDYQLSRRTDKLMQPVECFKTWQLSERIAFSEIQFQVKPPIFKLVGKTKAFTPPDFVAVKLDNRAVLPFTFYDGKRQIVSGSSKVVRVGIHHAHHDFNKEENEYFAMKTLEAGDATSQTHFRLEVKALMKIRAKERKHLVDVLTTFNYDNKNHLIFRWATGGNLSNLWNRPDPNLSHHSVCWLAQQCWGLADGLDGIHNAKMSSEEVEEVQPSHNPPSPQQQTSWLSTLRTDNKDCGRHGDIKPPNILWFKQDRNDYGLGTLKISDFGLTTFHTALTTRVDPRKEAIDLTLTYAAPEWDLKEDISRPFDIWSLGCVYLEFLTWALLGKTGIEQFRSNRSSETDSRTKFETDNFYSIAGIGEERHALVKSSVQNWIGDLKKLPQCSIYMTEFLDYIGRRMIIVDKTKRDKSTMVRTQLRNIFQRCVDDSNYALSSAEASYEMPIRSTAPEILQQKEVDRKVEQKGPLTLFFKGLLCFHQ